MIYKKDYCIYCHTNKINGKKYIGQTCNKPEKRWMNGKGYIKNKHFYNAIQKYGWDSFAHEILFNGLTLAEANQLEEELIAKYDTMNPEKEYNLKAGGKRSKVSKETRKRMSENHYDNKGVKSPWYGKKHSEETKKKIS